MEHKQLGTQRGIVHYWTAGSGTETLLFTHGATMDHGMFQFQAEYFSMDFKVISWDVPLHGLSRPYAGFSLQHAGEDLLCILDAEGVQAAHLIGQSMGGYISQVAAFLAPARVKTLTAIGSSPIQASYYSRLDRWLLSITPALLRLYPYNYLIRTVAKQVALTQPAYEYALAVQKKHTKEEIANIMMAVYTGVMSYHQDIRLTCPVLVTYGAQDKTGKVRAYSLRWAAEEGHELHVIPNAAHNANMDNPQGFNTLLDAFLHRSAQNAVKNKK